MTSRELVIRTLNHQPVPRIPRDLWVSFDHGHGVQSDALDELQLRYPSDIVPAEVAPLRCPDTAGLLGPGQHLDAWGCFWQPGPDGVALVQKPPLAEAAKAAAYQPPADLLDAARFAKVSAACERTSRFVLGWSEVGPFDRLRFLRGDETTIHDLARHSKTARGLLAMLHEAACRELELWAATGVDGVVLHDAWATADGLKMPAAMWCEIFRPLYAEYCKILHASDKFVFLKSSGDVSEILGDLVQLQVDAVHADLAAMNIERVARQHRGYITLWGGVGQPASHEPANISELRESVLRVRQAMDFGSGGLIAQCRWEPVAKLTPYVHFFEQWQAALPMRV